MRELAVWGLKQAEEAVLDVGVAGRTTMADTAGRETSSSDQAKEKVVRIKRKRTEDPFESLWLEVTPRAIKRQQPDLADLSLDGPATESSGVGAPTKLLFRRVETFNLAGVKELSVSEFQKKKVRSVKKSHCKDESKQAKAAQASAREARFEQIWRSRRSGREQTEEEDPMPELFHLYDVVRVDDTVEFAAKAERRNQAKREAEAKQGQLLCNYLPLLREVVPSVAAEIEALPPVSAEQDEESSNPFDYVYDVYALDEEMENNTTDGSHRPTIQIMDDDQQDWLGEGEESYDSEDSNDENNPKNDYPEEESGSVTDGDSGSDVSYTIDPYGRNEEEYDTVLSDEEKDVWRRRR